MNIKKIQVCWVAPNFCIRFFCFWAHVTLIVTYPPPKKKGNVKDLPTVRCCNGYAALHQVQSECYGYRRDAGFPVRLGSNCLEEMRDVSNLNVLRTFLGCFRDIFGI